MNGPVLAVMLGLTAALASILTFLGVVLYLARKRTRKARKTSNIVLVVLGLFALVFIVTMTVIFCIKGSVPDTLIQYTLGAGGVEAAALSAIKISKEIKGKYTHTHTDTDAEG